MEKVENHALASFAQFGVRLTVFRLGPLAPASREQILPRFARASELQGVMEAYFCGCLDGKTGLKFI